MTKEQTIGVFFGGKSPEHDISIVTGQFVLAELRKLGYSVVPVYVGNAGDWYIDESIGKLSFFHEANYEKSLEKLPRFTLEITSEFGMTFQRSGFRTKKIHIDVAFPTFHGMNGEDGTAQGLFELMNIPYVGCEVPASAITMDKVLTKILYEKLNIPTTPFLAGHKSLWRNKPNQLIEEIEQILPYPIVTKPSRAGSSIGIQFSKNRKELHDGLELAFHYDTKVIIEAGVSPLTDLTCVVMGNGEDITTSLVQESMMENELLSYEDKYMKDGGTQLGGAESSLRIPAQISDTLTKRIQDLSRQVFHSMDCSGIARVDFLYNSNTEELFVNEVNPLPGTLYHHLWEKSGIPISTVLERLIHIANQRYAAKQEMSYTFSSDVLSLAESIKLQMKKDSGEE